MPRSGRLHITGGCYHVIGRGLERRCIFRETADKQDFLLRLGQCLALHQSQCLAWAIMSNHYHLLIRVGAQPLSKLMAPLLGGFGGSYNRRHSRAGYVFQSRFKSVLCEENPYLLELVRYIHLNPVRAGMLNEPRQLDSYPWTGHPGLIGKHQQSWHNVDEVLCLFNESRRKAIRAYREFMNNGFGVRNCENYSGGGLIRSNGGWESVNRHRSEHSRCIGDERILGSSNFVAQALSDDRLRIDTKTLRRQQGWTLDRLVAEVCNTYELSEECLKTRARVNKLALAKSLICYWGFEELGLHLTTIGLRLNISQQAVSKWVNQGRTYCNSEQISLDDLAG